MTERSGTPALTAGRWGMGLLDWDHNAYYHRLLMRQLPTPCTRVLDVGCGAGATGAALKRRAPVLSVTGIERDPAAAGRRAAITSIAANPTINMTIKMYGVRLMG